MGKISNLFRPCSTIHKCLSIWSNLRTDLSDLRFKTHVLEKINYFKEKFTSMRSASSITRYVTLFRFVTFEERKSIILPGVQITICLPLNKSPLY